MQTLVVDITWQTWATLIIIAGAVYLYFREKFSIETISVGVMAVLLIFFHFFTPKDVTGLDSASLLSGFAAPALIAIMALLVVGQGMFHTGALEGPISKLSTGLDQSPRKALGLVFLIAFAVSMVMNNTPVVVMFIPILTVMAARLKVSGSMFMMPLSFLCILAGMTTLIGSSTNLLVNDVLVRTTDMSLGFFTQTGPGLILAGVGAAYIIFAAPILLPKRQSLENVVSDEGRQYIAQIRVSPDHPLEGAATVAGLLPQLKNVTIRMIQRGEQSFLPPFDLTIQSGDVLIVATTRSSLSSLLSSNPKYLKGMLNIAGFHDESKPSEGSDTIVVSEAVIAPASRMIGRNIEQIGFRRQTGCLVLGIQRRTRMIRKRMLEIRLEAGDVLLLFGYESDMKALRSNRDLLLLEWSTSELQDIRKARAAQLIFGGTVIAAATGILPIEIAALTGAIGMIAAGCLNVRQAVRALDMRIFLLIGAAFAMGIALEKTGAAAYIAQRTVDIFLPFGPHALLMAMFLIVALMTNIISNSAAALLFAPIALSISAQTGIDPIAVVMTVIFAANCSFATPIAYQTNLLVLGPGRYNFRDYVKFGLPLIILLWITFSCMLPFLLNLSG